MNAYNPALPQPMLAFPSWTDYSQGTAAAMMQQPAATSPYLNATPPPISSMINFANPLASIMAQPAPVITGIGGQILSQQPAFPQQQMSATGFPNTTQQPQSPPQLLGLNYPPVAVNQTPKPFTMPSDTSNPIDIFTQLGSLPTANTTGTNPAATLAGLPPEVLALLQKNGALPITTPPAKDEGVVAISPRKEAEVAGANDVDITEGKVAATENSPPSGIPLWLYHKSFQLAKEGKPLEIPAELEQFRTHLEELYLPKSHSTTEKGVSEEVQEETVVEIEPEASKEKMPLKMKKINIAQGDTLGNVLEANGYSNSQATAAIAWYSKEIGDPKKLQVGELEIPTPESFNAPVETKKVTPKAAPAKAAKK